jgi:hypothetical protein
MQMTSMGVVRLMWCIGVAEVAVAVGAVLILGRYQMGIRSVISMIPGNHTRVYLKDVFANARAIHLGKYW